MGRPVRNYSFEKPVITVGRDPTADVYVDNPGVSRDHFRLEKSLNGLYQVIDLGSANGTYVHEQMVNNAVVHNNDVIRFGKYTLWVGYEQDRRSTQRERSNELATLAGAGHTVVLSRSELGNILEKEAALGPPEPGGAPMTPSPMWPAAPAPKGGSSWGSLIVGFVLGTLFGASAIWVLFQR